MHENQNSSGFTKTHIASRTNFDSRKLKNFCNSAELIASFCNGQPIVCLERTKTLSVETPLENQMILLNYRNTYSEIYSEINCAHAAKIYTIVTRTIPCTVNNIQYVIASSENNH